MAVDGAHGMDSGSRNTDRLDETSYFLGYLLQAQTRLDQAYVACKALQRKGVRHGNCSALCRRQSQLTLPYACVQLNQGDRGISLHDHHMTGRRHNSGNAVQFTLVIDHVAQTRWSLPSHALDPLAANVDSSSVAYPVLLGVQTQPPCCVGKA